MGLLVVFLVLLLLAAPVLAFLAFVRVQKLTEQIEGLRLRELVARVYWLAQQQARTEKAAAPPPWAPPLAAATRSGCYRRSATAVGSRGPYGSSRARVGEASRQPGDDPG